MKHFLLKSSVEMIPLNNTKNYLLLEAKKVKSSYHMELEGLKRGFQFMQDSGIHISEVVTDRHLKIKKYMRTEHSDKKHSFDCWHICKGISLYYSSFFCLYKIIRTKIFNKEYLQCSKTGLNHQISGVKSKLTKAGQKKGASLIQIG